jgi:hypothetical protein
MGRIGNLDLPLIYLLDLSISSTERCKNAEEGGETDSLEAAASSSVDLTASSGSTCARLEEGGNMILYEVLRSTLDHLHRLTMFNIFIPPI